MSYAFQAAASGKGKVALVCKTSIEGANTAAKAQGGIASVTYLKVDNFDKHIKDTLIAGDYISDLRAVEQVVRQAPQGIKHLVEWAVTLIKKTTATSTCTARADTPNFAFCTMPTTRASKFSADSSRLREIIPASPCSKTILPLNHYAAPPGHSK